MKKTFLVPTLALGAASLCPPASASAQEIAVVTDNVSVTEFRCDNKTHYYTDWRDNWFIELGAGVNQPLVEGGVGVKSQLNAVDGKKVTAAYNLGFGRWCSPYLGFRISAMGGSLHWDNPTADQPTNGWARAKHVNLNADLMWDMLNSICGPDADRVFSIIPYVGIGGDYTWNIYDRNDNLAAGTNILNQADVKLRSTSWTLPVSAGLQFRLRLCEYADFFAEARASFYGDNWNGCAYGNSIDANVAVLGGLSFNIGGRDYKAMNQCDYVATIADLNNQVNVLRAQTIEDAQAIATLEAQLPCPKTTPAKSGDCINAPLMTTVRFALDSDVISNEEEVNVYNMAQWLKENPNQQIIIVGYADKDTGTSEYNMALSERRANAVADRLVSKYGIDRSRLTVKYDGSDVQPYPAENDWNRIVIFRQ